MDGSHRRRAAAHRLPVLASGHADPWQPYRGRCGGYVAAATHLAAAGLLPAPPDDLEQLRAMWRRDRGLAGEIAAAWELAR